MTADRIFARSGSRRLRLLVVDDHTLFREALARLLSAQPGIGAVLQAGTVADALQRIAAVPVDVVLLDMDMGWERGSDFFAAAKQRGFEGHIVLLTGNLNLPEAAAMLANGAAGIMLKTVAPETMISAIEQVAAGMRWIDPAYVAIVLRNRQPALTEPQQQVLRAVVAGLSSKQIGLQMGRSEAAVKRTLQQLFRKTGTRNRAQLVGVALQLYKSVLQTFSAG